MVCGCVCVWVRERSSQQLLASDSGGVLFVTRTGLSPPPGVSITMIVMAMECEWQAGSHVVAGEQEARTAPVSDISLSFIKTLHSFITTHSLCCKISAVHFFFFTIWLSHVLISLSLFYCYFCGSFSLIYISFNTQYLHFSFCPHPSLSLSLIYFSIFLSLSYSSAKRNIYFCVFLGYGAAF